MPTLMRAETSRQVPGRGRGGVCGIKICHYVAIRCTTRQTQVNVVFVGKTWCWRSMSATMFLFCHKASDSKQFRAPVDAEKAARSLLIGGLSATSKRPTYAMHSIREQAKYYAPWSTQEKGQRGYDISITAQRKTPIQLLLLLATYTTPINTATNTYNLYLLLLLPKLRIWSNLPPSLLATTARHEKQPKGQGRAYRLRRVKHGGALGNRDLLRHSVQLQLNKRTNKQTQVS